MSDRVKQNKPTRPFEHLTEWVGAQKGVWRRCLQGRQKKYYPKRSAGVEIFFSRLYTLASHVFVEQRERLTNTFLPALFLCGALNTDLYRLKIKKCPQRGVFGDIGDLGEIEDLCFFVFVVCKVVYQSVLYKFGNVFFGGFVGNIEALSGFYIFLS